ncbi:ALB3.2, partial [Symbiodinium necroappetens]
DGGDWFDPFVSLNANIIEAIDSVIGSAGAAIILYTILVKVVTYPLQQPALRASALLQMLSPQLEEINRQYKDDEDKKGQTLRDLYGKVGLNPFLSLVPVLFQIPLFVALFRAIGRLASQDDHFKEPFLWIPSLAGPVSQGKPSLDWLLKTRSSEAFEPLVGWQDATMYCVLPLLVFLAQFLSSRLSSPSSENSTNGVLFPLFIGISTLVSPSGVGVYWFTNTVLTTAQMKVTQDEVAEEFPEYKQIKDDFDAKENGARYTRASPFKEEDAVKKSVDALKEPEAPPKKTSRKERYRWDKVKGCHTGYSCTFSLPGEGKKKNFGEASFWRADTGAEDLDKQPKPAPDKYLISFIPSLRHLAFILMQCYFQLWLSAVSLTSPPAAQSCQEPPGDPLDPTGAATKGRL